MDRRTATKIIGGTVAGLIIGGAAGYLLKPEAPAGVVERTVTVTAQPGVTTPTAVSAPTRVDYLVWTWAVEFQHRIVENYNKKHPGANVVINELPQETFFEGAESRLLTSVPTDVMFSDVYLQVIGAMNDWVVTAEDYFPEIKQYETEFPAGYVPGLKLKGKMMGLHKYGAPTLFHYNSDILSKAGFDKAPTTWDEVAQQAIQIKKKGLCDRPMGAFLGSYGFWQTIYAFIAGFSEKETADVPMFDANANPIFVHEDHPLFKALKFIVKAVNVDKTWDPASVTQGEPDDINALGSGAWGLGWMPAYDFASINDPSQKMYPNIKQAVNPGSKYTSCWIRPINLTTMALKRGKDALEQAYKFMIYYSGKVDPNTLEPDFKNGEYLVQKEAVALVGDWTAIKEVWTYPEVQERVKKFADPTMLAEQDKYLFLHQMDPDPSIAPYWARWSGGFGSGPGRVELEALMLGQRGTSDNDIMNSLKKIEDLWKTTKSEYKG